MIVGRLGMPELGGSYFTFSNENNDLIWGFLAECHRRGWLYKGHDTMPWCARCGTGISQTEAAEGYQDRDDPGLTIRLPLLDRPGESLLVWTTTPWTLTSNVAAAVGEAITYVRIRQGEDVFWLGRGTLKAAVVGPFEVLEERPGRDLVGWRYAGPFDELPAVRERSRAWVGHGPAGRARTSIGSSPGTRSAKRRGPASSMSHPVAAPRTSSSASVWACRSSRRSTSRASSSMASRRCPVATCVT